MTDVMNPSGPVCPRCGAATGAVTEERPCRYCGMVLVPPPPAAPRLPAEAPPTKSRALVLLLLGGASALLLVVCVLSLRPSSSPLSDPPNPTASARLSPKVEAPRASASAAAPAEPEKAKLVLRFGAQGDGPGHFHSAGLLAVDQDGSTFVTDAKPSRVQQFDPTGKFVRQYELSKDHDCCIHGLAVDHAGHLYVSFRDAILRFKTSDGSALTSLDPPPPHGLNGQGFEALAVDPYDMLYGLSLGGDGEVGTILKFDRQGKSLERVTKKADEHVGTLRGDKFVFDGLGNIFFAQRGFIEVLDRKWALQNRIGQEGTGPGTLPHFGADAIAPDGHGHLLVLAGGRIDVFDVGGRYRVSLLDADKGHAPRLEYLAVGMDGRLYATTADAEVVVYTLDLGS